MESNNIQTKDEAAADLFISSAQLLEHWQGHRRLTRRLIEAFPEDKFFTFSVGGMRPFAALVMEMAQMAAPGMNGIVTRKWAYGDDLFDPANPMPASKGDFLDLWDEITEKINLSWQQIPSGRFQERDTAFGQYEGPIYSTLLYFIDNEIHHRGQGYVYLRALGIDPPPFWER